MTDWPHAPVHRFAAAGTYFVTGATLHKQHFYRTAAARDALQHLLFGFVARLPCWLQAWTFFSNHYHLVVKADDGPGLRAMLAKFHSESARMINECDGVRERTVWFQFWDTELTYERSWLARLRYTHMNAEHHGLVDDARRYPWCSARWFEDTAKPSLVKTVQSFRIDRVNVYDDFGILPQ